MCKFDIHSPMTTVAMVIFGFQAAQLKIVLLCIRPSLVPGKTCGVEEKNSFYRWRQFFKYNYVQV